VCDFVSSRFAFSECPHVGFELGQLFPRCRQLVFQALRLVLVPSKVPPRIPVTDLGNATLQVLKRGTVIAQKRYSEG
ncbi:MAG: hypothetical protein ACE5FA_12660, partial [Dehalococcoidia bacterium]